MYVAGPVVGRSYVFRSRLTISVSVKALKEWAEYVFGPGGLVILMQALV